MNNGYLTFSSGVQALRRRTELLSTAIGGALGVAADPYPHQLATVSQVLTDVRIRHLIADEVGLGKTVQALMIINALRSQTPTHKTVVVAPERLIGQWLEETWTRAHVRAALIGTADYDQAEPPSIILVRPKDIMDSEVNFRLNPVEQTLLIIDEPQSLQKLALDALVRASGNFRQLLILSATPGLSNPQMRETLLAMIEPERSALAATERSSIETYFSQRESQSIAQLQLDLSSGAEDATETAFRVGAVSRRIIRQSRLDWGEFLPQRKNFEVLIHPIRSERLQLNFVDNLMNSKPEAADFGDFMWTSTRAILRSRVSARQALGRIAEQQPLFARDALALRTEALNDPGNSRLAPLLDLLSTEWAKDAAEKFIIVCGDAATTDMLSTALSRYFPELATGDSISVLKRPVSATEESAEDIREMSNSLRPFTDGNAKILLIGDWVQPGLNLQFASRNIVFYSLPWEPEAVDQFIGRIDRLRRNGPWKAKNNKHFGHIRIWRLILKESPEEYVSRGLDALGIFNRPLPQIPETDMNLALTALEQLARRIDIPKNLEKLKAISNTIDATGLHSNLAMCDPNTPSAARKGYEGWQQLPLIGPAFVPKSLDDFPISRMEEALRSWLKIVRLSGDFDIRNARHDRSDNRIKFSTFWYKDKRSREPFYVSGIGTDNWMTDHAPFLSRRRTMSAPPRRTVHSDDGETDGRLLNFFDHGNQIHDDLIKGYVGLCNTEFSPKSNVLNWAVSLPNDHPALRFANQPILMTAAFSDPGARAEIYQKSQAMRRLAGSVSTPAQQASMELDLELFADRLRTDVRWLRSILPAMLQLRASRLKDDTWIKMDDINTKIVFGPLGIDGAMETAPRSRVAGKFVQDPEFKSGCIEHRQAIEAELRQIWKTSLSQNRNRLSVRNVCIQSDGQDLVDLRRQQEAQKGLETPSVGQENMWRGQVEALRKRTEMAEQMLEERSAAMSKLISLADLERPSALWHIVVRFMPFTT